MASQGISLGRRRGQAWFAATEPEVSVGRSRDIGVVAPDVPRGREMAFELEEL